MQAKVAVVTGASMGIGEAIAKRFVEEGANVVVCSRDLERAEAARMRIGREDHTLAVACDVTKHVDISQLLKATLKRFGRVDVWVNNAGHGLLDSVATMDMAACRQMFDTNLFGAIDAMQAVVPLMRQQGSGCVINISSVAGHIAVPYMAAYCATKHALNAISKAARLELKSSGIHVITVCPGYIRTDFAANAVKGAERMRLGEKLRRGITAERVARAVLSAYLLNKREVVVPWKDRIAIHAYQAAPRLVDWFMTHMVRPAEAE